MIKWLWQKLARRLSTPDDARSARSSERNDPRPSRTRRRRSNLLDSDSLGREVDESVGTHPISDLSSMYEEISAYPIPADPNAVVDGQVIHNADGEISFVDTTNSNLCIYNRDNTPIVTIDCNTGEVTLNKDFPTTDAAREFWNAVEIIGRSRLAANTQLINGMEKIANERNDYIGRLTKEIEQLKNTGTSSPDQQDNRFMAVVDEI